MHLKRRSHCRVKLNRCFNVVRAAQAENGLCVVFFWGRVRICFSFVPKEANSSTGF